MSVFSTGGEEALPGSEREIEVFDEVAKIGVSLYHVLKYTARGPRGRCVLSADDGNCEVDAVVVEPTAQILQEVGFCFHERVDLYLVIDGDSEIYLVDKCRECRNHGVDKYALGGVTVDVFFPCFLQLPICEIRPALCGCRL